MARSNDITASELQQASINCNLDNVGQVLLNPNIPHHHAAMSKLGELSGKELTDDEKKNIRGALDSYHKRVAFPKDALPKEQVHTFLSLLLAITPDTAALQQAGLTEEISRKLDIAEKHDTSINQALKELKLGAPLSEDALKQKLPQFLGELDSLAKAAKKQAAEVAASYSQMDTTFKRLGGGTTAALDSAGQTLLVPRLGVPYSVAQDNLKHVVGGRRKPDILNAKLGAFHVALMDEAATFNPDQVKVYLSLLHEVLPDEKALLAKGMEPERAAEAVHVCQEHRNKITLAMKLLGMGDPLTGEELKAQLPAFLDGLPSPTKGRGK